jgi:hypothetical protein
MNAPGPISRQVSAAIAAEPDAGMLPGPYIGRRELEVTGTVPGTASGSRLVYAAILPFDFPVSTGATP